MARRSLSELSTPQKAVLGSGAIVLVGSFLPWYGVGGLTVNGWDTGLGALGILVALVGAAFLLVKAFEVHRLRVGGWEAEHLAIAAGGIGALLVLAQWLTVPRFVRMGLYLTLAGALLVAHASYQAMREEGVGFPWEEEEPDRPAS